MPKEDKKPKDEKTNKDKSKIDAKPSIPLPKERKPKMKELGLLEETEVNVVGGITAGTWVAEFDKTNIRKNTLRLGDK